MSEFNGFPRQLPRFFKALEANNSKEWFLAHKKEYEIHVKIPCEMFVSAMGDRLKAIRPTINAIPKINKSLFRLNRDTRFVKDKRPYKTNLGILFWDGPGKRMESSGFYFHVEDNRMMLGCGLYRFPKSTLHRFREAVIEKKSGNALEKVLDKISLNGYSIFTKHYKRLPRGFKASSEFEEELLRYNGLTARIDVDLTDDFYTSKIIDAAFSHFKEMFPLHKWIMNHL